MAEEKEESGRPIGAGWRQMPLQRKVGLLSIVPTVFLAFYTVGFSVGRLCSPDYSSIAQTKAFVAREVLIHELSPLNVRMSVSAGTQEIFYSLADDQLERKELSLDVLEQLPKTPRDTALEAEDLAKIAGAVGVGAVLPDFRTTLSTLVRGGRAQQSATKGGAPSKLIVGAALVVAALGGGLGFESGYKDEADFDSEAFRTVLADKGMWRQWAQELQECVTLFPERVGAGLPSKALAPKRETMEAPCARKLGYASRHRTRQGEP